MGIIEITMPLTAIMIIIIVMSQKSSSMGLGAYESNPALNIIGGAGFLMKLTIFMVALLVLQIAAINHNTSIMEEKSVVEINKSK